MSVQAQTPRQIRPRKRGRKKGQRDITPQAMRAIVKMMFEPRPPSGPEIERRLNEMVDSGELAGEVPLIRTIQRVRRELLFPETTDLWRIDDGKPEDAALILQVLGEIIVLTKGRKRTFIKQEAEWVLRIRKMIPDADSLKVWDIARSYLLHELRGQDSGPLDVYLSFTPWRSKEHYDRYWLAIEHLEDVRVREWGVALAVIDDYPKTHEGATAADFHKEVEERRRPDSKKTIRGSPNVNVTVEVLGQEAREEKQP